MNLVRKMRRGDDLRKLLAQGDFRAGWNALAEIWDDWRKQKFAVADRREDPFPHPAVVLVGNNSGVAVPRFGVLQVAGPLLSPNGVLPVFQQQPNFLGVVPTNPPDTSRFVIMLEPVQIGHVAYGSGSGSGSGSGVTPLSVGRAVIAGAVACLVNVTDTTHGFAVPVAANTSYLASSSYGGAVILSQPTVTGLQWCQVLLGACCAANFTVRASGSGSGSGSGAGGCANVATLCPTPAMPAFFYVSLPGLLSATMQSCMTAISAAPLGMFYQGACQWKYPAGGYYYAETSLCAGGWAVTFTRSGAGVWTLAVLTEGGVAQPATYSVSAPAWDGTTALTLTATAPAGGGSDGFWATNWPATATVCPCNPCASGGGGSGGGSISSLGLGTASASGSPANLTLAGVTVQGGTTLVVCGGGLFATAGSPAGECTFNGASLTLAGNGVNLVAQYTIAVSYYLYVPTTTTGDIVLTVSANGVGPTEEVLFAVQVLGLAGNALDIGMGNSGNSTTPAEATNPAHGPDYVQACVVIGGTLATFSNTTWGGGFTDGGSGQAVATAHLAIRDGYKITAAAGPVTASAPTLTGSTGWSMAGAALK